MKTLIMDGYTNRSSAGVERAVVANQSVHADVVPQYVTKLFRFILFN
jgi:hypothetical protein